MFESYVLSVSTAHNNCQPTGDVIACEGLDIMLNFSCPDVHYALNITKTAKLRLGDDAVAVGYISSPDGDWVIPRSW